MRSVFSSLMSLEKGDVYFWTKKNSYMKKNTLLSFALFFASILAAQSQTVTGKWKTTDEETGKPKSVVEIYEKSGKIYGKIIEIFDVEKRNRLCTKCPKEDKNKPVLGMVIIKGLSKDGDEYNSGQILDPVSGKLYKCFITVEGKEKLNVRGYVGISLLGRTQIWTRIKG
jgi:uncharacterized protein (DUF2147 family)